MRRTDWKSAFRLRNRRDGLLIGAAIGVGMTAQAAERGGADFLLALNAGRLRVMGAASLAAMLPIQDSNDFTDSFARREILDRVGIPVLFGAFALDHRLDPAAFVDRLAETGYAGIANFPTIIHYDGRFRQALEDAGLGYAREVALLRQAKERGLLTLGYAKSRAEVDMLLEAEIDIVCLNFGWNAGGSRGVLQGLELDEVADRARRVFLHIRGQSPETLCVVEGGPIVSPDQMYRVCHDARADGYLGGSTLDRVPLELSVAETTSAFKTVSLLRGSLDAQTRDELRLSRMSGLVGQSEAMHKVILRLGRLAAGDLPVLVIGEAGAGKTQVARAVRATSRRRYGPLIVYDAASTPAAIEAELFGARDRLQPGTLEKADATILIENIDRLPAPTQLRLVDWLDEAMFERRNGMAESPRARIVCTTTRDLTALAGEGTFREDLRVRLLPGLIEVPPLRERPEDVPLLARSILEALRTPERPGFELDAEGYRILLSHDWPENVRELRSVLESATVTADGSRIRLADLHALIAGEGPSRHITPVGEREWILDALRRNRFRRAETAVFLGISRKTLYNKMKYYDLLP
ncbi:phosphoenolpyruvate hydrolase family protein [Telmatospirillum sp. J64-1]|uniref:phosphoenolpyruvate hydrolase family protein n=1 Tax=Telmatospirillum sp. J64-1 TaxID=2502183 RepID=UPI00115DB2F1|nr:phosphoenolpyruvate hydrolase family protein [Telmatospirillum sp. J64-1]